jgi:hypothetical protein
LLTHHDKKPSGDVDLDGLFRVRGSSSIPGAVNTIIRLEAKPTEEKEEDGDTDTNGKKKGRPKKQKVKIDINDPNKLLIVQSREAEASIWWIEREPETGAWTNHGRFGIDPVADIEDATTEARIISLLDTSPSPLRADQICMSLHMPLPSQNKDIYKVLNRAISKGKITKHPERYWDLQGNERITRASVYQTKKTGVPTHPTENQKKSAQAESKTGKGFDLGGQVGFSSGQDGLSGDHNVYSGKDSTSTSPLKNKSCPPRSNPDGADVPGDDHFFQNSQGGVSPAPDLSDFNSPEWEEY